MFPACAIWLEAFVNKLSSFQAAEAPQAGGQSNEDCVCMLLFAMYPVCRAQRLHELVVNPMRAAFACLL